MDVDRRNSLMSKESNTPNGTSLHSKNTKCTVVIDDNKTESDSEPEEGEITDSEQEECTSEDEVTSEGTVNSEDTDSEGELTGFKSKSLHCLQFGEQAKTIIWKTESCLFESCSRVCSEMAKCA